jgi:hypothetical protein
MKTGRHPNRRRNITIRQCRNDNSMAITPHWLPSLAACVTNRKVKRRFVMSHTEHQKCISACIECAQECGHCGDACIDESRPECARNCIDCAEVCWLAAAFMSRGSKQMGLVCELCAKICEACAAECRRHKAAHCRKCAEACRRCAKECRKMSSAMA